jgi:hypothetical protein
VHGESGRVDVGEPSDVVPSFLAVLVLQVAHEVVEDEAVHRARVVHFRPRGQSVLNFSGWVLEPMLCSLFSLILTYFMRKIGHFKTNVLEFFCLNGCIFSQKMPIASPFCFGKIIFKIITLTKGLLLRDI